MFYNIYDNAWCKIYLKYFLVSINYNNCSKNKFTSIKLMREIFKKI